MNIQHVLRALEAGEISPEDAKIELASLAASNEKLPVPPEVSEEELVTEDTIAIIGMSGKYPDAPDLDQYWNNLVQGKNSIRVIPSSRWQVDNYYDPRLSQPGKVYCKWIGMLDDIDCFDPLFFNISPAEAEEMDPQQRLFLQEAYHAFEDAGYSREQLNGSKCGVYLGIMSNEYGLMLYQNQVGANSTTGNSFAIAAARLPYYLNLKGPAVPVDTACSSSLVAAHLACQALRNGEIDMALVGGVTLYLTPESYISMCGAGMLSPDGQCKTFDSTANGFVPGEGAGALVFKRLKDAVADKDHIYGVIIGSGLNQDGKTNGITAPSANSQMELERGIYEKYSIDPGTIGYVEMHGTGTKLGDPIELEALSTVYGERTDKKNYCAIGSVKSNIGHTSAAAGIASIQKVLLSINHQQLVPTLNFEKPNDHFDFKQSPFYVNTEVKSWESIDGAPLRAGVSAFGFSGTNAHFVIEQYVDQRTGSRTSTDEHEPVLVVLSAKSEDQLRHYAKHLVDWLKKDKSTSLRDVAFTLQTGREPLDYRLAVRTESKALLLQKLDAYVNGLETADLYCGNTRQTRNEVVVYETDAQASKWLESWLLNKQLDQVADIWVKGAKVNWAQLYKEEQPYRVSLPTYPFLKNRYWFTNSGSTKDKGQDAKELSAQKNMTVSLHPLIQRNTSDLFEQRYSSTFSGTEFFLAHHVVGGERMLPGAAYLEMAHKAAQLAGRLSEKDSMSIRLRDIVFERPFIVQDGSLEIHTRVNDSRQGGMNIEIYSEPADPDEEPIIYCRGKASNEPLRTHVPLDLKTALKRSEGRVLDAEMCYELFERMGIKYGAAHRGIKELYVCEDEVLGELLLPDSISETADEYTLHPSIVDSALQASIGFMLSTDQEGNGNKAKRILPHGIKELELIRPCTDSKMRSRVTYSDSNDTTNDSTTMDIHIYNSLGELCVLIRGFSVRVVEAADSSSNELMLLQPVWQESQVSRSVQPIADEYVVLLCGADNATFTNNFETPLERTRNVILQSASSSLIDEKFTAYAKQAFEEIKTIISSKPLGRILIQLVVPMQNGEAPLAGLLGLLRSAEMENSRVRGQLIQLDSNDIAVIKEKLLENRFLPHTHHIRYQQGKRLTESWVEVDKGSVEPFVPWKERGVYLLTGGMGGLGRIFAKEIASKAQGAVLILTGRSSKKDADELWLDELNMLNVQVEYRQLDVTDGSAVDGLIQYICERFGSLNGIIHSAGMKHDNYIVHKSNEEFVSVIAPKVSGLANLDRATKELPLDFFLLFSSLAGSLGNQGQSDYAAANAFMDTFSDYRNQLAASGLRHGTTLAINWPLWKEGGMQVDAETERMMLQRSGIVPMQAATGIQALYTAYATGLGQVMVMEGRISRIREQMLRAVHTEVHETGVLSDHQTDAAQLRGVIEFIEKSVCSILKVKREEIDEQVLLTEYGFDSITFTKLTNELNEYYRLELTPAVFFEYPTMMGLAGYLCTEHTVKINEKVPAANTVKITSADQIKAPAADKQGPVKLKRRGQAYTKNSSVNNTPEQRDVTAKEAIAIIGVSGLFPMADDLDAFWANLASGRDCISEIPPSRWDWQAFYGNPITEGNKTKAKWGGFINGVDEFDPLFFGISPKEAEFMDPQQRLLMTYVWKAIEDAGYAAQSLSGTNTGIFAGTMNSGYSSLIKEANAAIEGYSATGLATSIGPNRMSYFLNIHGPSEPIETACSSSLVAIHRAVRAIQSGDCDMAIAGGINTIISPELQISFSKAGMLCEDGRCKTFSSEANGYVRGEGVGMLLLKKLSEAEASGDHIYGVIRGTAENHGGRAASLTAPNPKAQADLLLSAYRQAGIDPATVTYIETHGTGTSLGDPIEINGLKSAFKILYQEAGAASAPARRCGLGSVKSNIGHLELAAGVAGVIKVLLQMKHKKLVKSLHCETLNPYIQLKDSPFYIVQEEEEWKALLDENGHEIPRRAGVSSFGFGGANAHVVIEEYTAPEPINVIGAEQQQPVVIVLSAKDAARLKEQTRLLLEAIRRGAVAESDLERVAYTLQVGREAMDERLGFTAGSLQELEHKLHAYVEGKHEGAALYEGQARKNKEAMALIGADEDWKAVAQAWMHKRKYDKLLAFWTKGLFVDWNGLYQGSQPKRISLPTYPFAKERYWVINNEARPGERLELLVDRQVIDKYFPSKEVSKEAAAEALKLVPIWDEIVLPRAGQTEPTMEDGRILILNGTVESKRQLKVYFPQAELIDINGNVSMEMIKKKLQHGGDIKRIVWLSSSNSTSDTVDESLLEEQEYVLMSGFRLIKAVLELGYEAKKLRWDVFTVQAQMLHRSEWTNPVDAGIYGLMGTLAREFPSWEINIVDIEVGAACPFAEALALPADRYGQAWVYRDQRWQRSKLAQIKEANHTHQEAQRMNGVYVVIGGAGGIGEVWTEHMVRKYKAQVVWLGRRASDEVIQSKLEALGVLGPAPLYLAADATDPNALEAAYIEIKNRFGAIHGVVHAAVDLADQSIRAMDENRFRQGLKAKTDVSIRLAQVFRHEMLDFVLFFSSMNSFVKTPGQSSYVAGCLFKDSVAHRLSLEWSCKVKIMNWGYWGDVGAGASDLHRELMSRAGIASIESAEAMDALEALLYGPLDQMVFLKTSDRAALKGIIGEEVVEIYPETLPDDIEIGPVLEDLTERENETESTRKVDKLQTFMLKHVSELLQVGLEEIQADVDLYDYGFDPILLTELVTLVNRAFGVEITPLTRIENPTVLSISRAVEQQLKKDFDYEMTRGPSR